MSSTTPFEQGRSFEVSALLQPNDEGFESSIEDSLQPPSISPEDVELLPGIVVTDSSRLSRLTSRIKGSITYNNFKEIGAEGAEDLRGTPKYWLGLLGATAVGFALYIPGQEYLLGHVGTRVLRDSGANPLVVGAWVGGTAFAVESAISSGLSGSLKHFPRATNKWREFYFNRNIPSTTPVETIQKGPRHAYKPEHKWHPIKRIKKTMSKDVENLRIGLAGGSPTVVFKEHKTEEYGGSVSKDTGRGIRASADIGAFDFGLGVAVTEIVRNSHHINHEVSTALINVLDHSETWVALALFLAYSRHRTIKAERALASAAVLDTVDHSLNLDLPVTALEAEIDPQGGY